MVGLSAFQNHSLPLLTDLTSIDGRQAKHTDDTAAIA